MHIVGPDGCRVPLQVALDKGLFTIVGVEKILEPEGYRYQQNSLAELKAAAREIHERSSACQGWRETSAKVASTEARRLHWPMPSVSVHKVVEYPEAFPQFSRTGG